MSSRERGDEEAARDPDVVGERARPPQIDHARRGEEQEHAGCPQHPPPDEGAHEQRRPDDGRAQRDRPEVPRHPTHGSLEVASAWSRSPRLPPRCIAAICSNALPCTCWRWGRRNHSGRTDEHDQYRGQVSDRVPRRRRGRSGTRTATPPLRGTTPPTEQKEHLQESLRVRPQIGPVGAAVMHEVDEAERDSRDETDDERTHGRHDVARAPALTGEQPCQREQRRNADDRAPSRRYESLGRRRGTARRRRRRASAGVSVASRAASRALKRRICDGISE